MTASDRSRHPDLTATAGTELVCELYRVMRTIRAFEEGAEQLHKDGVLSGPFHSSIGQEAVAAGVCSVLGGDDVITSTHRGHGHLIAKGADIGRMLAELRGRAGGYSGGRGGSMHLADFAIGAIGENGVVGASMFLATGAALGFQHLGQGRVAVGFFGDGGAGQGIFHECLNLAAIWRLPVVYVCENNQYAHSFPSRAHAFGSNIASLAHGYGIAGVQVDGNDALAVWAAAAAAVERARSGGGPSLIEALCYRWRGHNLNDAHHLYRSRDEVEAARAQDPVAIMRARAVEAAGEERTARIDRAADAAFGAAVEFAEASALPDPATIFAGVPA